MKGKEIAQLGDLFSQYIEYSKEIQLSHRYKIGDKIINAIRLLTFKGRRKNMYVNELIKIENEFKKKYAAIEENNNKSFNKVVIDKRVKDQSFELKKFDVIIPIHNALEDVKKCLESVISAGGFNRLIIINDGSDKPTTQFLNDVDVKNENVILIHHKESKGYTISINEGITKSNSEFLITLNSDTIVPERWINIFSDLFEKFQDTAVFGPLCNAASYQSVPKIKENGDWCINKMPNNLSVNDFSVLINSNSLNKFPEVPFVNGVCFAVRKKVLEEVGFLDEANFPRGYGEENDLCIRIREKGYKLRVADNLFIFHAKSKSFGHETRKSLAKQGRAKLIELHTKERLTSDIQKLEANTDLVEIRDHVSDLIASNAGVDYSTNSKIAFYLPVKGGSGGAHSVVQEACGMRKLGVESFIINHQKNKFAIESKYSDVLSEYPDLFVYLSDNSKVALAAFVEKYSLSVLVATIFTSAKLVKEVATATNIKAGYYVQDYEPWFFEKGHELRKEAEDSYDLMKDDILFAKTDWICDEVYKNHGVKVNRVFPSIDHSVYYPMKKDQENGSSIVITAMIRPNTPRRGAERTMLTLKELVSKFKDKVSIKVFGCEDESFKNFNLVSDFNFESLGVLTRNEVADLLREADVFLDLSDYQAFGRTGLEAMACECIPVLPELGGVYEYATKENSVIVDPTNFQDTLQSISEIVENKSKRDELLKNTVNTSFNFSIEKAAWSEIEVLL